MTDTPNKLIDDAKEELTEAELGQVAGGINNYPHVNAINPTADVEKKPNQYGRETTVGG